MRKILLFLVCTLTVQLGLSQVDFELGFQHNGRFDFTMIGASLNSLSNNNNTITNCAQLDLAPGTTASDELNLMPSQRIEAAYLYWSSSAAIADRNVTFNGVNVGFDRVFTDVFSGFTFSGAVADVTDIVQTNGNGTYSLENLDINRQFQNGSCGTSYGGWVCVVVFEDPILPLNSVNVFDGFNGITSNNGRPPINIDINDLLVANDTGSFLGIVAWEGDSGLGGPQFDEEVRFNGELLSNASNPADNLFNESNSFDADPNFFNMDMDRFNIDQFVNIGDQEATIRVESEQDLVIMNVIAFTLGNELPEPTVTINDAITDCNESEIRLTFDVNNFNANEELPANTSVKFFVDVIDNTPELEIFTMNEIPIDGSETLSVTLPYPPGSPTDITVFATINLDLTGETIILELNSNNNTDFLMVNVPQPPQIVIDALESCDIGSDVAIFDLDSFITSFENANLNISISIHESATDANNNQSPLTGNFTSTSNNQSLFARQVDMITDCIGVVEFNLVTLPNPNVNNALLAVCSDTTVGAFTLSVADAQIASNPLVDVTYYATLADAESETSPLPNNFSSATVTIFARAENRNTSCFSTAEVMLTVSLNPVMNTVENIPFCEEGTAANVTFDLTIKDVEILGGQDPAEFPISYFESAADATNDVNPINNPTNYTTISNPQSIFYRIENVANSDCFLVGDFEVEVFPIPNANDVPISVPTCSSSSTAIFNLLDVALDVANNNQDMIVEFFPTQLDAENDTNMITNPGSFDTPTTTVFGKVINPTTMCFGIGEVSLEVLGNPNVLTDLAIESCATDANNTSSAFDLSQFTDMIIGSQQNVTVSYHLSQADASSPIQGGINPIVDPTTVSSTTGVIFARAEADFQGITCQSVSEIELTVNPRPTVNAVAFPICSNVDDQEFDLATQVDLITGGATNQTVQFFNTENGADNNDASDEITSPITTTSTIVFARVTDDTTGCFEVGPLQLEVIDNPEITTEITRSECLRNEIATFDLEEIITTTSTLFPQFSYSLHESELDANDDISPLGTSIQIITSQTLFLRIGLPNTDCFAVNEVLLDVPATPLQDFGQQVICLGQGFTLPNGDVVDEPGEFFRAISDPVTGCDIMTRTELIISEIDFPSAFTPNGDGVNDTFRALPGEECVGEVSDFELTIWNRWGEKVYESRDFLESWDGRFNGQLLDGIYLWTSSFTFIGESFEREGSVVLFF